MSLDHTASSPESQIQQGSDHLEPDVPEPVARQGLELRAALESRLSSGHSYNNLNQILSRLQEEVGGEDFLDRAIALQRQKLELQPSSSPDRLASLNNLALALTARFEQDGQESDLDEAISSSRQALELHHSPDPDRFAYLASLANVLDTRFQQDGQSSDLDEAILLNRQALGLQPPPNPDGSMILINLVKLLHARFEQDGREADLDEAISLNRQALELQPPGHPCRPISLSDLATEMVMRLDQTGQETYLDQAIALNREALELRPSPHPDRSLSLANLALAVGRRFEQEDQKADLDEAILLNRQALELQPPPHPFRHITVTELTPRLVARFDRESQKADLDEAILLNREALDVEPSLDDSDRSIVLSNLACALWKRVFIDGQKAGLDEAISLNREALELLPPDHPDRSMTLNNLADMIRTQFDKFDGQKIALEEVISLKREALEFSPLPNAGRSMCLVNLAIVLHARFEGDGQKVDLDEAILLNRQALELQPPPNLDRSMTLTYLANVLGTRFLQENQKTDLDEAIFLTRQALELERSQPSPESDLSIILSDLAKLLHIRFEQDGQKCDLDEAISFNRQAVELRPSPHPYRPLSLSDLANALSTQFERDGQKDDLEENILLNRQALEFLPTPSPHRSTILNNLGQSLRIRFERDGYNSDLDQAISFHREAVTLQASPHPDRSRSLSLLAMALVRAHSPTDSKSQYFEEAMELFSAATQCFGQTAFLRLDIAYSWIKHANTHHHSSTIDAYDAALQALPNLAALNVNINSRQKALLAGSDGLARDASRFAMKAGKLDKAIEFLESGRAVFWSQFLSLRSPFEELHEIAPELADKLQETAVALELGSHRNTLAQPLEHQKKFLIDQETARLNRLNEVWSKTIDDVRQLEGFKDFLRPRTLSTLKAAASEVPVVIPVGSDDGTDIFILTSTKVQNVHLSGLRTQEIQHLVYLVQAASAESTIRCFSTESFPEKKARFPPNIVDSLNSWLELEEERGMRYKDAISSDAVFRSVLNTLWDAVVKPVIDFLDLKKSEEPPVVRWCPTGFFSFLPLHAAGCYENDLLIECASDYFISSYTPTIGALLTQDHTRLTESFKMMAVIHRELPSTRMELEKIERHVPADFLVKLGVPGAIASVEEVASHLSDSDIVHFSCHGTQNRVDPLDSGLKVDDGWLRVSRIMKEKIPNRALAFLCACETAMGDEKLPDEAMSLGASLLFSGFRSVVATMWEMMDEDGPTIADAFYKELFRGPDGKPTRAPDTSRSAHALHIAVKKLRSERVSFRRWVPFIHMGK
ncbi:hypothetical protein GALMADRAFT_1135831 [Galerina marginata CBS 339.88]|uniref:CHAT domain-containing protein n=1 Tax=Galerina marginata (strain CBS 339.88) TaxID=685588 RepID=A0A067SGP5_GALM3|nr:hypothetical protein GALMADRAFT_1135831 [Galerina marginata CBS 339.88]